MDGVTKHELFAPDINEIVELFHDGLKENFSYVNVDIAESPNLTEKPFSLAAKGLCGSPRLAYVGGLSYLLPVAQNKLYSLETIAKQTEVPNAFFIGAGLGARNYVGGNSEMMINAMFGEPVVNKSYIAKLVQGNNVVLENAYFTDFSVLGTLLISEGEPGKVIKIHVKKRTGSKNFVSALREILAKHYGEKPVGMGGVFILERGKAELHVIPPEDSSTPLETSKDFNSWLKFLNMSAPLVCLCTFISHDPNLDLFVEHTHCFSEHGEGGHYHIDTTPDEAEYLAYLNVAECLFRIDKPNITNNIWHG